MSKIISKDNLTDYRRWELPSMDEEAAPTAPPGAPAGAPRARGSGHPGGASQASGQTERNAAFPTLEEIEAIQKEAYEEGQAAGLEEGREAGRKQGLEAGRQEGFEIGHREGMEAAIEEINTRAAYLQQVLDFMSRPLEQLDEAVEAQLAELAVAVARQLVRRELKTAPGEIVAVVRETVALLPAAGNEVILHLHPEDGELVSKALGIDEQGGGGWKIKEDPTLTRGGCRVDSGLSRVDATVERRLNGAIAAVLGDQRSQRREQDDG